jgi:hypothetical protein
MLLDRYGLQLAIPQSLELADGPSTRVRWYLGLSSLALKVSFLIVFIFFIVLFIVKMLGC